MNLRPLILLLFLVPLAAQANVRTIEGAPDGFEQLAQPRLSQIRLVYGGEKLGAFRAHITPASLAFDFPEQIVAAVPSLKEPLRVENILRNAMPLHSEFLCTEKRKTDCGVLRPDIAGIIFDERTLTAELFINPTFLAEVDASGSRYLPLPERNLSSVYQLSGAISGAENVNPSYAISHNAVFSLGEMRLSSQSTFANQGFRFDTAQAGIERNGWSANLGLFRSHALQLIGDRDMAGVSIATSSLTRLDNRRVEGSPLLVYLPRRSFVSLYREGRLYSSRAYEAGNQIIDTSELPEGAYTVLLRIQEADSGEREEQRFFAKSPDLPPPDAPVYYAEAGVLRAPAVTDAALPQVRPDVFFSLGTVQRVNENLGLRFGALGINARAALETGAFWLYDEHRIKATGMVTTKRDYGFQFGWIYASDGWGITIDAAKVWAHNAAYSEEDLTAGYTQATGLVSFAATPALSLGLRGNYFSAQGFPATASFGPYADWRIWQEGESELGLSMTAARSDGHYEGAVLLHFSKRFGHSDGISGTAGDSFGHGGRGPLGSLRYWHDGSDADEKLLLGMGMSADTDNKNVNADVDWRNDVGLMHGAVQKNFASSGPSYTYGGNLTFNAAQLGDSVHVGGEQNERSAVMIEVDGEKEDGNAAFQILVDGMKAGRVRIGERHAIYLAPFHSYKIRLLPIADTLLDFDHTEQKVTLYPGNVTKLHWQVRHLVVIAAKIIKPDGSPLANALFDNSRDQVSTDEEGRLQAEMPRGNLITFTQTDGARCNVILPRIAPANGVLIYKEALRCD
jgi:hypothetical protein